MIKYTSEYKSWQNNILWQKRRKHDTFHYPKHVPIIIKRLQFLCLTINYIIFLITFSLIRLSPATRPLVVAFRVHWKMSTERNRESIRRKISNVLNIGNKSPADNARERERGKVHFWGWSMVHSVWWNSSKTSSDKCALAYCRCSSFENRIVTIVPLRGLTQPKGILDLKRKFLIWEIDHEQCTCRRSGWSLYFCFCCSCRFLFLLYLAAGDRRLDLDTRWVWTRWDWVETTGSSSSSDGTLISTTLSALEYGLKLARIKASNTPGESSFWSVRVFG